MGVPITPPVAVQVVDQFGDPFAATVTITVALGANPGSSTLAGTLIHSTYAAGVALFDDLALNNAALGYTLTATSAPLTGATSAPFTIITPPTPAPPLAIGSRQSTGFFRR